MQGIVIMYIKTQMPLLTVVYGIFIDILYTELVVQIFEGEWK